jgi:hypothetical protein
MLSSKKITSLIMAALLLTALAGCEKPEGKGGKATVKGKVYASDFDNTQRYAISRGYVSGEKVYIVYGNTNVVGDDTRTSYDGSYEFKYLTKGHYKVYVNSLDTTEYFKGRDMTNPVIVEFDITDPKKVVTLEDFKINI